VSELAAGGRVRRGGPRVGPPRLVALAGGVGAARFLRGLVEVIDPAQLTVVVNTADDIELHGLWVSPDIDSVIYGLSGLSDEARGWGVREESWCALEMLARYGEDTWFQLGDRDLATHIWRTNRRRAGQPLSAITAAQCAALGITARILPMSDDVVTTRVRCSGLGELHLQEYFVRERCGPTIEAIRYDRCEQARPARGVLEAITAADALIVCPSNPVISVAPILAVPGIREALRAVPQGVAVTPIVAGQAVKGPAARMLEWLGVEVSAAGVASLYSDIVQTMVVDERDGEVAARVAGLGVRAVLADTLMDDPAVTCDLARTVLASLGLDPAVAA
jgi:LPPG:FO 2-phospho-L-lactate transferase